MQGPPSAQLSQIATGHFLPRCLHVVAELGVADLLSDAPMTAEALALASGTNAGALDRMFRLLATAGIFEACGNSWSHTELSRTLRSDHPHSMRAHSFRMIGGRQNGLQPAGGVCRAHGKRCHHEDRARRHLGLLSRPLRRGAYIRRCDDREIRRGDRGPHSAFDFTRYGGVIADIGGGRGHVLAAVLAAAPNTKGILFDLPPRSWLIGRRLREWAYRAVISSRLATGSRCIYSGARSS